MAGGPRGFQPVGIKQGQAIIKVKKNWTADEKKQIRADNRKIKQHEQEVKEYLWEYNNNAPGAPDKYEKSSELVHWELE